MHTNGYVLPELLALMLEENHLPVPPLPFECLNRLDETDDHFFATDPRDIPTLSGPWHMMDLDFLLAIPEVASADDADTTGPDAKLDDGVSSEQKTVGAAENGPRVRYVGCGLKGHGLQSWAFYYLLDSPTLKLAVSVPWGGAWGDADEERQALDDMLQLISLCQLNAPASGCLRVVISSQCQWQWSSEAGQADGNSVESLLDVVQQISAHADSVPSLQWMRV